MDGAPRPVDPWRTVASACAWLRFGARATTHALRPGDPGLVGCRLDCAGARTADDDLPWDAAGEYGGWGGHAFHGTAPGVERPPVVFVHGNGRDACDWERQARYLRQRGFGGDELWAITFREATTSHPAMVAQLDAFVERLREHLGVETVAVVAHSLGVTGARYWLDRRDRYGWVETFVGIAGPNHGVSVCAGPGDAGVAGDVSDPCRFVGYECADDPDHPLARLNADCETPGDLDYYTIRGRHDCWFYRHPDSPRLDGATANELLWTDHEGTRTSARTRKLLYDWLSG